MSELTPEQTREAQERLQRVFTCQICGQPKTHHRLYGYRCHNPEHHEQERALDERSWKPKDLPLLWAKCRLERTDK